MTKKITRGKKPRTQYGRNIRITDEAYATLIEEVELRNVSISQVILDRWYYTNRNDYASWLGRQVMEQMMVLQEMTHEQRAQYEKNWGSEFLKNAQLSPGDKMPKHPRYTKK